MGVNKNTCLWILDFLVQRPQFVFLKNDFNVVSSSIRILNTGAPQGTVLSPILFIIYTNDCRTIFNNIPIIKYADDTIVQALISSEDDLKNYKNEIERFTTWCDDHCLLLNVKKTKELIFDFRKKNNNHTNIVIKDEIVDRVSEFKYLGVIFDENLDWESQACRVNKKINQRLYFMRKLYSYKIENTIISLFYQTCILSILNFCLIAWSGNAREKDKMKINKCLKSASKLISNSTLDNFDSLGLVLCSKKLEKISKDQEHPLFYQLTFSSRSGRLIHPKSRTSRYLNSFIPLAIRNCDKNKIIPLTRD